MYIHSLSSFCAFEPVSISANKDILILLLLAQMKRMLQTWAVIVHDVSNSCCGPLYDSATGNAIFFFV